MDQTKYRTSIDESDPEHSFTEPRSTRKKYQSERRAKPAADTDKEPTAEPASNLSAFVEGFLTNGLNPKTSMFYLAAFLQFITIGDGAAASAYILVLLHTFINVAWFGAMVILLARLVRFSMKGSFQRWLKGVTGIVFIAFGVKLATFRV